MAKVFRHPRFGELITPNEAAKRVHLSEADLAKRRRAGKGPCYIEHNGQVWYVGSEVDQWLIAVTPLKGVTTEALR